MTNPAIDGGFIDDPAQAFTPPSAGGCCGSALAPAGTGEVAAVATSCCGTATEAAGSGACCGTAAKAETVTSGAGCCG